MGLMISSPGREGGHGRAGIEREEEGGLIKEMRALIEEEQTRMTECCEKMSVL